MSRSTELRIGVQDAIGLIDVQRKKADKFIDSENLKSLARLMHDWDEDNALILKHIFSTDDLVNKYRNLKLSYKYMASNDSGDKWEQLLDELCEKTNWLQSIQDRLPLYALKEEGEGRSGASVNPNANQVFIVHGRNNEIKQEVARVLEKLKLNPIILHEQPSGGMTLIEKFEKHSVAGFAIILLTADDVGGLRDAASIKELQSRARQNVIFEWGFFVAKLGRCNVFTLVECGVEFPSDMDGIVYCKRDLDGAWKLQLVKELRAVGFDIDASRLF